MNIRRLTPGEEPKACEFVCRVFYQTAGVAFGFAGIDEFYRYANQDALKERLQSDHVVIVVESHGTLEVLL